MSRYLEITSVSRPFFIGTDGTNRAMLSCNYECIAAAPVDKFEEEIARILFDAGLAVLGTNANIGPSSTVPAGAGPVVTIIDQGGMPLLETHNADKYERMAFQTIVRALDRKAARTHALAVWRALDGQRNITVVAA